MRIGIVGGGINGLSCAWLLSQAGHEVQLYERDTLVNATSRASSKLLHGGLRYLEQYEFRLVREALRERDAWLQRVPNLAKPLQLVMPIYRHSRRQRWLVGTGLFLYDKLAGKSMLPPAHWLTAEQLFQHDPQLKAEGLLGGYAFSDGQMDDYQLGLWVAQQARDAGASLHEQQTVDAVDTAGNVHMGTTHIAHDYVINVAGPWAVKLLEASQLPSPYRLDTVRGSHLVIQQECPQAYLLEVPNERRIFFVLPWQGQTLVGTTEVRQAPDEAISCSRAEHDYLLAAYNYYRTTKLDETAISSRFAGVRPLLYSANDPGRATREYAIERNGKLINVFGGKWTTTLALARQVMQKIQ